MATLQWATSGTVSGLANNQQGNLIAAALATASQGASAPTPSTTGLASTAGLLWHDTTNNLLKLRDQGDTTWITLGMIDEANKLFTPIGAGSKEFVINGGQMIDQRNEGGVVNLASGSTSFITDQFHVGGTYSATNVTAQQVAITDLPGYSKALKVTIGTGVSVGANDEFAIFQNMEGINVAELGFGTSSAKAISLGFWAKSSLTPTFGVGVNNSNGSRSFFQMVTLAAANTWQWVPIAGIPGDTAGTWLTGPGQVGLSVRIGLSVGSAFQGTAGVWQSANVFATSAQTQLSSLSNASFTMTGLTLRALPAPVLFDRQDFAAELVRCLRYYEKSFALGVKPLLGGGFGNGATYLSQSVGASATQCIYVPFKVPKANAPQTLTVYNPSVANNHVRNGSIGADCSNESTVGSFYADLNAFVLGFTTAPGSAAGHINNFHWSAESGL